MNQDNYHLLLKKLDEFSRKYYFNLLIRGLIWFLSLGLALLLTISVLEHYGNFSSITRTVIFYSSAFLLLFILTTYIVVPISKILNLGKRISHEQAADIIGKHFTEVKDKLLNVLQLKESVNTQQSDLIEASIAQKVEQLKPIPFSLAIDFKANKKHLKYLLPPLTIVLCLFLFSPEVISESTSRIVMYGEEFEPTAPYSIEVKNKKLEGFKNEDFLLEVELVGDQLPNLFKIELDGKSFLMNKEGKNTFKYHFKNLKQSIGFRLTDGEFTSKQHMLNVLPKPSLLSFDVAFKFPSYLKKKDLTLSNTGDIEIPQGTEVTWNFETADTESFLFHWSDSSAQLIQTKENTFSHKQRFMKGGKYGLSSANSYLKHEDTLYYSISVIPDRRPSIELDVKQDSLDNKTLYFKVFVKDDYGFSRLMFHAEKDKDTSNNPKQIHIEIPINKSLPQTDYYHSLNLNQFELGPNEAVTYYFEILDNDGVNGSKSARTPLLSFKAPSRTELQEQENESNKEIKKELEENIKLSQEIKKDLESLKEKVLTKKELGFQEKKQIKELLKKQKQLKQNMQDVNQKNKQKNQLQNDFSPMSEELLKKQEQLQELFEKVMSDEMKELMAEMEKMMEKMDDKKLMEQLEKMELSNEDVEKKLDRNLELFKQLEVEKQLKDAQDKLNKLREEQAQIQKETEDKNSNTEELKEKQEEQNKEFESLKKDLSELKKKNEELEEPFKMEDTESLEDQIKNDMKESAQSLGDKKKKKASESQENAEEGMEKLSNELSNMQMEMESSNQVENLEDLRALLENLITLSFDQENIMEDLKKIDRTDPKYVELAQMQSKIKDDSKVVEDSLFALSKRVIQLEAIVNREMTLINRNMEKAIDFLGERNTAQANARQQLSMTSINNLALILDEAIQNMQKQMQSMMQSKGECKKPGSKPGGKPSAGGLKKMQQQLQKQMEQLKKAMEQGKQPNGKKGQGQMGGQSQGGMSKQLAQMAAKQAAIRKALEDLQEQIGESNSDNGGGNLKKIGELMEENETDLVNKRITNETILRQQEILTRLLQSEKAEREREKDPKREAIENQNSFSRNPNEFFEYNRRKENEIELLRTIPPKFNSFYKSKVTDYFNLAK